jgi:phospho-N-acetylmuramoyl-pentapeptide-transferase
LILFESMLFRFFLLAISTVFIFYWLILYLKKARFYQHIYELSPGSHQSKNFTPSFGGVGILLSVLLGVSFFPFQSLEGWWSLSVFILFSGIGFLDDVMSLKSSKNKGLSVRRKFTLQCLAALFFIVVYHLQFRPLAIWEVLLYCFLFVGTSNATNLTDGLDGLLGGLGLMSLWGFYTYFIAMGSLDGQELSLLLMIAIGGFLLFNRYPAQIFMGDTGSLGLGAVFASFALMMDNPWILIPLGAVYLLETLSVIIQVLWFKRTGKRVFLMAPLHHHFEMLGLREMKVVSWFWAFGAVFLIVFFATFKP